MKPPTIVCACELAAAIEDLAADKGLPCTVIVGRSCYEVTAPTEVIHAACAAMGIKWSEAL